MNVKICKLRLGGVQIIISKPRHEYDSATEAREALHDIGIPEDVLDFHFGRVFVWLLAELSQQKRAKNKFADAPMGCMKYAGAETGTIWKTGSKLKPRSRTEPEEPQPKSEPI